MKESSLFLTPSAGDRRANNSLGDVATSPSSMLLDVVPFEAALQRLLYERIQTDEQLASYSVQQAYRGLLYAVRASTLSVRGLSTESALKGAAAPQTARTELERNRGSGTSLCVVRGWQAVLYQLSLAAARTPSDLACAVFLSVRILCDAASAHGEGNERPCCTAEWTQALLLGLPLDETALAAASPSPSGGTDARFAHLVQTSPRYQLGYLLLLSNTLRMVASGRVDGHHLCSDYLELFRGVATELLPRLARYAEASARNTSPGAFASSAPPPTRLAVEWNNAVLHSGHWLAMDVLAAHIDADIDAKSSGEGSAESQELAAAAKQGRKKKRVLVLDREQPTVMWGCVTLARNALRRSLGWLEREVLRSCAAVEDSECTASALLRAVSQQLEGVTTDLLRRHEYLQNARLNATRAYSGLATRDVHALTEAAWAHTLEMCFLLRNATGVWVSVHGGLGYGALCPDQLLPSNRDVLMLMASALVRIPALEAKREGERETFLAVDASLCALLALVAAAPSPELQSELWASDNAVTKQVHAVLVQRALRFHDERVLKLTSLLSRAVLDAAVQSGALAGFAADSADQLLELLESDDDAASRCVGELLSVAILQHPYRLIPALFRLLQHGNAATRRNVLQVLCSLPNLLGDANEEMKDNEEGESETTALPPLPSPSRPEERRRRDVLRLLAEHLLLQLQDEEVALRLLSSSLFAKVHPSDVLQPLLNLCIQRDPSGRRQSAALAALTSVLAAHTRTAATYVLLLDTAYRCHLDISGSSLVVRSPTPSRGGNGGGEMAETITAASTGDCTPPPHRPVPQTPGDILTQTLLYSTNNAAMEEEEREEEEGEKGAANTHTAGYSQDSPAGKPSGGVGALRRKEAHLHRAITTLSESWVRAALPVWSVGHHSLPLLRCLANAAVVSPQAESAVNVEGRVQFYMKYTLRATSVLTAAADLTTRTRHLLAVWNVFFADAPTSSHGDAATNTWAAVTGMDTEVLARVTPESVEAKACVHIALLPLLCLRSCAPGTFCGIVEREGARVQPESLSLDSDSATQLLAEGTITDAERVHQQVLSALWHRLWSAVATRTEQRAFFSVYPDIQRVLLEVLCRFSAAVFFAQWQQWGSSMERDKDSDSASADSLFRYRVYVFGVSAYLAASVAPHSSDNDTTPLADLAIVLQHHHTLLHVLDSVVPRWLMADTGGQAVADVECARQRLCAAALDAGGVLGVVALADPLSSPNASSFLADVGVLGAALETAAGELLRAPLLRITLAYRSTTEGTTGSVAPDWTVLLTRFQLCLRTHASLVRAITAHPHRAKGLLLLWFRHYLRAFVDLSNAACTSVTGRTVHGCRAAVDACGAVFQAVLIARKMDDAMVRTPTSFSAAAAASSAVAASEGAAAPTLCHLAWEEKDALVSFSVGCTRFAASPAVQTMGVRLLSAVIVAAPEIFLELSATQATKTMHVATPAAGAAAAQGADALQSAVAALQSAALLNADRQTRVLAEEVLGMLRKAYAAEASVA